jgi:Spy/CpxP family protein refolding chaperone
MWRNAKDLLLLLSLSVNVPFILMWAAANAPPKIAAEAQTQHTGSPLSTEFTKLDPTVMARRQLQVRPVGPPRSDGTRSVYRELGVTGEQWCEIEPRLGKFRSDMFKLAREMKRQRDQLVNLVAAPELDYDAIQAKQEEILDAHRRTGELVVENMLADREILTPEQRTRFFKKMRDFCAPTVMPKAVPNRSEPTTETNNKT